MSDKTKFESVVTHTYTVRPVTRYVVEYGNNSTSPALWSTSFAKAVCECHTKEQAESLARLLAGKATEDNRAINITSVTPTVSAAKIAEATKAEIARALRRSK